MKTLYIVGGAMGVGKTAACQTVKYKLPKSVFLDGDWCWDMHPFQVTDETKRMVLANIRSTLNNFLRCSAFDNVIFCWVLHEQGIIDDILSRLSLFDVKTVNISLVCDEATLKSRLQNDIDSGIRHADVVERALSRLPLYQNLNTQKIDVTALTTEQTADAIIAAAV